MSDSAPDSSSVLLTVDEKSSSTRGSQYTNIAPKTSTATLSQSGLGLSAIAPATESRADGTPMLGGSPSASSDRGASSGGGNGEGSSAVAGKRKTMEGAGDASKRKTAVEGAPEAGSEEWLRLRRLAHKEVEQRRRDVINTGIDRLAELVPGAERHRGRIVNQAVDYIHRLKETEAQNIEKWTIEKLLADQVISGLTNQLEQMKRENKRLKRKIKAAADGTQLVGSPVDDDDDDNMDQDDEQDESNIVSSESPIVDESMASEAAAAAATAAGITETNDDDAALVDTSKPKSKPSKRRKK
ncbi:basic helix-loop-helix protein [Coemansia pectinata]|uniref:Basic helix-loop-helix protein n=1 Tax=Coemansia pectinata TaxID=1052879 RepID=A0A9W8GW11_9FUNG|nr:basic helix-loop-helix protein [Coemansia pectinata]